MGNFVNKIYPIIEKSGPKVLSCEFRIGFISYFVEIGNKIRNEQ